jgi:hypothetical protein
VNSRACNTGQNLNTGILVFLNYETGIPVLMQVFQKKKTFFSINFGDSEVQ